METVLMDPFYSDLPCLIRIFNDLSIADKYTGRIVKLSQVSFPAVEDLQN